MRQAQLKPRPVSLALLGEHSPFLSIVLHLVPGVLTGAVYFALRPGMVATGFPPHVALVLAVPLAMIPWALGLLVYLGYKRNGRLSLEGVMLYRERIPVWQYFVYVPLVFAAGLAVFGIGGATVDAALRTTLFAWMPPVDWDLGTGYARTVLVISYSLTALFVVLGESVVEELYFRGFLLPRMKYAGRWTTPLHSLLFALHHVVWMPWRVVSLTIGILPLVIAVRRTRNIYVGMIAHMMLNSYDLVVGVAFILAMKHG